MSSQVKPIKVYGKVGPNPPKVGILLTELGVPHEVVDIPFSGVKSPKYLAVNPNGRLPSIFDPNTDITLWESGAILEYLLERYDTTRRFTFAPGTTDSYLAKQWGYYQVSGQGPYYGQAVWFSKLHPEQLPSAIERFTKEVNRVTSVLEGHLAQQKVNGEGDGPWFVGNKYSYVDIVFAPWQWTIAEMLSKDAYDEDKYPHVKKWLANVTSRDAVKAVKG